MDYVFEAGAPRRVMHIERKTIVGEHTFTAICGQEHAYNRTINAPFGLGRKGLQTLPSRAGKAGRCHEMRR